MPKSSENLESIGSPITCMCCAEGSVEIIINMAFVGIIAFQLANAKEKCILSLIKSIEN